MSHFRKIAKQQISGSAEIICEEYMAASSAIISFIQKALATKLYLMTRTWLATSVIRYPYHTIAEAKYSKNVMSSELSNHALKLDYIGKGRHRRSFSLAIEVPHALIDGGDMISQPWHATSATRTNVHYQATKSQ